MFLHGLMGSAANWRRIIRDFEKDYQILAYDQRGHGRSFKPDSGYGPQDYAEDLVRILDDLGWEKIYLVGHSMGGRNALEFSHHYMRRIIKLVIEDIGPNGDARAIEGIERLLALVPTPFSSKTEAKNFFENEYPQRIQHHPQPVILSQYFYSNMTETPEGKADWRFSKEGILESVRAGRKEDRWDMLRALTVPTLVVRGDRSEDLPREIFARMLRENPKYVTGIEIADSGHWVHFDQPEAFVRALQDFFQD